MYYVKYDQICQTCLPENRLPLIKRLASTDTCSCYFTRLRKKNIWFIYPLVGDLLPVEFIPSSEIQHRSVVRCQTQSLVPLRAAPSLRPF